MTPATPAGRGDPLHLGRPVLVAPDKLKGTATAPEVAAALARGLTAAGAAVELCPVADGGDGTVAALLAAGARPLTVPAQDALGRDGVATVALRGDEAVVELAEVCGLARLDVPAPLDSGTTGLGLVLRGLLDRGVRDVVVGLGGSASTDGGLGLLAALGARAIDATGAEVPPTGRGLLDVVDLDVGGLRTDGLRVRIACDVDAPLHGPDGAAPTFAAQKGATPAEVDRLDAALVRWGTVLHRVLGREVATVPGAGAAGGTAAALLALGGQVVPGAATVLEAVGFDAALARAGLVVTGEGRWDATSLRGKAPGEVVRRAAARGVPVVVVAGQVAAGAPVPSGVVAVVSLTEVAGSVEAAQAEPLDVLERVGRRIGEGLGAGVGTRSEVSVGAPSGASVGRRRRTAPHWGDGARPR